MPEVTRLLNALQRGESADTEELLPLVYDELRRLAASRLAREHPDQTLQATELVHEAWMRLVGDAGAEWQNRGHFFGAAAEAMRRILVDHARRKLSQKRGGGRERVALSEVEVALQADDETLLRVHDALDRLALHHAPAADLVRLRFFGGFSQQEVATILGLPERTAGRLWAYARAWLYLEVQREP